MAIEEFIFTDELDVSDEVWRNTDYAEELPPEMNTDQWKMRREQLYRDMVGISSGSSSSSSSGSSSHSHTSDPRWTAEYYTRRYIEDLSYLIKLIIELYDLSEIKPLYDKMYIDHLANTSMYRYRIAGAPPEPKKKENLLDDELFKI